LNNHVIFQERSLKPVDIREVCLPGNSTNCGYSIKRKRQILVVGEEAYDADAPEISASKRSTA
jgi:hypothetical protein